MYTPPDKTNRHFIRACGRELYEAFRQAESAQPETGWALAVFVKGRGAKGAQISAFVSQYRQR